jgi:hypothetical protein
VFFLESIVLAPLFKKRTSKGPMLMIRKVQPQSSVNKMKRHWIILKLNYILSFIWDFVSLPPMKYDSSFGPSFCLPFGKALGPMFDW